MLERTGKVFHRSDRHVTPFGKQAVQLPRHTVDGGPPGYKKSLECLVAATYRSVGLKAWPVFTNVKNSLDIFSL